MSVCVIAGLTLLFLLPLVPLPEDVLGSCLIDTVTGSRQCSPDRASLSFVVFGQGLMSSYHGSIWTYTWCTRLGGWGYNCAGGWSISF